MLSTLSPLTIKELLLVPVSGNGGNYSPRSSPGVESGDISRRPPSLPSFTIDKWFEDFGAGRLTVALLDGFTHHVHTLEMNGVINLRKRRR